MRFIEFVTRKMIGKPDDGYWTCPFCNEITLDILPQKAGCKERLKCRNPRCRHVSKQEWWKGFGDELDLIRGFHPNEDYDSRLARYESLREEYENRNAHDPFLPDSRGSGDTRIKAAYDMLKSGGFGDIRMALVLADEVAEEQSVNLNTLVTYTARELKRERTQKKKPAKKSVKKKAKAKKRKAGRRNNR